MQDERKFRIHSIDPFLKTLPGAYFESIQQRSKRGTPDYMGHIWGRFVAIEAKTDTGQLDALQAHRKKSIEAKGGILLVARPQNWHDCQRILYYLSKRGIPNDRPSLPGYLQS